MDWSGLSVDHLHARRHYAQQLTQQALGQLTYDTKTVLAAYAQFGASEMGQIILWDLNQRFQLADCKNDYDEGARRLVIQLHRTCAEAPGKLAGTT